MRIDVAVQALPVLCTDESNYDQYRGDNEKYECRWSHNSHPFYELNSGEGHLNYSVNGGEYGCGSDDVYINANAGVGGGAAMASTWTRSTI